MMGELITFFERELQEMEDFGKPDEHGDSCLWVIPPDWEQRKANYREMLEILRWYANYHGLW